MQVLKPFYKAYEGHVSKGLKSENIPKHVAIMMDGNRRYSRKINKNAAEGHKSGANTLIKVMNWCIELGIEIITVYALSINNLKRPKEEVEGLMKLFQKEFEEVTKNSQIHKNEVKIKAVGNLDLLPENVRNAIRIAEESTASYDKRILNFAIGYDGRIEIVDAIKEISKGIKDGILDINDIDEDLVSENLHTTGLEDPDLIIRTSGEERLSGFLLWQSSYSELYFCDNLWPEIRKLDILRAVRSYQDSERRFEV